MLMLVFYVGDYAYAIDCQNIVEVFPRVNLKKIPNVSKWIEGLLNISGKSIVTVDICQLIDDRPSASSLHTRIILISNEKEQGSMNYLGIIAEKVIEVIDCNPEDFIDSGLRVKDCPYLKGIMNESGRMIQLLDVEKFFYFMENFLI